MDYLAYDNFFKSKVQEENISYEIESKNKVHQEHDKIFKKILENKKEAVSFINQSLKLQYPINEEEIERYNSSFITENLKSQESDIIYKLKEREIYFLIEHQTKIDYTMPLRILEYEYRIIKSAIDIKKFGQKGYKLPMVISIVLYSGRRKWNAEEDIRKMQGKLEGYQALEFARYNLIDINCFSEEELLQEKTLLSKAMLIEKARHTANLVGYLEKIITEMNDNKYEKEQKELLSTIINLVLSKKIGQDVANRLIKKLKERGGENMLAVLEMIDEENKKIFKKGERKGRRETARKMIEEGLDVDLIVKITDLSRKEIENLK